MCVCVCVCVKYFKRMKIKFYTTPSLPSPLQKSPLGRELQTLAVRLHLHSQKRIEENDYF